MISKKTSGSLISDGLVIVILLFIANASIILDIPLCRQIFGIILLCVIPGLLILLILKLDKLGLAERIVLTLGVSIAFLMLFGLAINQILLQFNYMKPLTTGVLLLSINFVIIILLAVAYVRNKEALFSSRHQLDLNTTSKWFVLISTTLPLMSILGTNLINSSNNNLMLLGLLFVIPILVILFSIFNKRISANTYPLSVIMISASLLFMFWLRSPHILGEDINNEYRFFQLTLNAGHWAVFEKSTLDSCLSISILPTIFQCILNFSGQEILFKGVFAVICAFTPLVVYIIAKKYVGEALGFLSSFYFMSQSSFLITPGSARTNLAIFFFAISIMVLFLDNIKSKNRNAFFLLFIVATIVSHYTTTYIFFFLLLATFILSLILNKYCLSRSITWVSVVFFAVVGFIWYALVVQSPYTGAINFLRNTLVNLGHIFTIEARGTDVGYLFGSLNNNLTTRGIILIHAQSLVLWLSFLLIAVGIIGSMIRYKRMLLMDEATISATSILKSKFDTEYFLLAVVGSVMLVVSIAIPYISLGYDLIRIYEQTAVFLSVFLVVGGMLISQLTKINKHIILLIILIPYFLFTTFAAYEVLGLHETYILNSKANDADYDVINEQETIASLWLEQNMDGISLIYTADSYSANILFSQGLISDKLVNSANFDNHGDTAGYIYLSTNNVVNQKFVVGNEAYDINKFADILNERDLIFSDGGSEIYK